MEIIKADQISKKRFVWTMAISVIIVAVVLHFMKSHLQFLQKLYQDHPEQAQKEVFILFGFFLVAGVIIQALAGFYFIHFSQKIIKADQFPPPGTVVLKDTPVLKGPPAKRRAMVILGVGLLMVAFAILLEYYGCKIWMRMLHFKEEFNTESL